MRRTVIRYSLTALWLTALPLLAAAPPRVRPCEWAQPVLDWPLKNFYRVSDEVYRSRQPDAADFRALEEAGVKSVLNLRDNHSDDDEAAGTALKLFRVPTVTDDITDAGMVRALRIIRGAPKPILVHCWHGSDRTGVVIALYRIVVQGWTREAAIDELVNGGYGYHAKLYPNIVEYIRTVDLGKFTEP